MIKISFFYTAISLLFISKSYLQSVMDDYAEGEMFNNAKPYEGYTKVMGKSLGCYSQDILVKSSNLTSRLNWTNATVKRCWTHCAKQRFAFDGYAALQNRSNCLCSLDINNKTSYKRNDCNKTCAANKKETCGGNSSVSLYEIKTILIG